MTQHIWGDVHRDFSSQDWIDKPSIFAEFAINYFPHHGDLLELGAGLGQDSRFFAEAGYNVIATDIEPSILELDQSKMGADIQERIQFQQLDMRQPFPIADNSFDIVYAHLSLHFFDEATTRKIFAEIGRILKHDGVLAFLVRSKKDPGYGTGHLVEEDFYQIDKLTQRYFSAHAARDFNPTLETIICDEQGETYKDRLKSIHNLVRYIGKKKAF